jgi:hypothetical protein
MANKVGRPSDYDPKYCEEIIEYMGQGFSKEAFAGHISVSKQTLYNWMASHKEFLDAVNRAEEKCRVFWEELGIQMVLAGQGNATTWIFNMKNRFNWKDRSDVTSDDKALKVEIRDYGDNANDNSTT